MTGATDRHHRLAIGPRSIERPADAGATIVTGIDALAPARVDGGGAITPDGAGWSLDWWIGADDRWYFPSREATIRQRRIGAGPVVETAMRVPSGDVVSVAYPALLGDGMATVVEVTNRSPVPVALAFTVRPEPVIGSSVDPIESLRLDGSTVLVDGRPAIHLPRPPNEAGAAVDVDLVDHLTGGQPLTWPAAVGGRTANAVCLYPLPHDTSLRVVVPSVGAGPDALDPASLPGADTVARGWTAVVERPAAFDLPDDGLGGLARAARARLLIAAPGLADEIIEHHRGGSVLQGLAVGGYRDPCRRTLEAVARWFPTSLNAPPDAAAAIVEGVAAAAELIDDPELTGDLLEPLSQLTNLVERADRGGDGRSGGGDRSPAAIARRALGDLASLAGQPDAAAGLWQDAPPVDRGDLDTVMGYAQAAAPAGRWNPPSGDADVGPDPVEPAARFWLAVRSLVLDEDRAAAGGPVIDLLPGFATAWRGGEVEVRRAPARGCRISFAIRWHGFHPALLWEVEPNDGRQPPTLTCSALDPTWRTDEVRGETLLAGLAEELPDTPAPGESFT